MHMVINATQLHVMGKVSVQACPILTMQHQLAKLEPVLY